MSYQHFLTTHKTTQTQHLPHNVFPPLVIGHDSEVIRRMTRRWYQTTLTERKADERFQWFVQPLAQPGCLLIRQCGPL